MAYRLAQLALDAIAVGEGDCEVGLNVGHGSLKMRAGVRLREGGPSVTRYVTPEEEGPVPDSAGVQELGVPVQ